MKRIFVLFTLISSVIVNAQFWTEKATGFAAAARTLNSISLVDTNVIWATAIDNSIPATPDYTIKEFTRSTDGGVTWTPGSIDLGAENSELGISSITAISATTAWVSVYPETGGFGGVWKTTDSGVTWAKQATALFNAEDSYNNLVHFWDANSGITVGDPSGNEFEIYTTIDGGTTWTRVSGTNIPDPDADGEHGYFNLYTVSGNTIWFGTDRGRIYKSTDKGLTWAVSQSPSKDFGYDKFTFSDANKGLLMTYSPAALYRTTDGGNTWNPVTVTGNVYNTDIAYIPGTSKVVSGSSSIVPLGSSFSLDDGVTWTVIDDVPHGTMVFLNDSYGFSSGKNITSTDGGIFKYTGTELSTPTLSANPVICTTVGSTASISVTSNVMSPSYQWQCRKVTTAAPNPAWITITSANAGTVYSNYTTATLGITKTSTLPAVGTQYRVIVTGTNGSLISNSSDLSIIGVAKAGTITTSPAVPTVCAGNSVTLTLGSYVGTSVQWQTASTLGKAATATTPAIPADWANINGATASTFNTGALSLTSNKYYRVIVINSYCGTTIASATKTITINSPSNGGIVGVTVGTTSVDTIQVSASSSTKNTLKVTGYAGTIQWEYSTDAGVSWSNVPSGSASKPSVGSAFTTTSTGKASTYVVYEFIQSARFRVKATNGTCSSVTSTNFVTCALTSAVATSVSATNSTVCSGTSTTLTLATGYTGTIKWIKSTNNWATSTTVTGTSPTVSTGNLTVATAFKAVLTVGKTSVAETAPIIINVYAKPVAMKVTSPTASGTASKPLKTSDVKVLNVATGYTADKIEWEKAVVASTATKPPASTEYSPIDGAFGESYTITNACGGKNYFRAKFTNGGCATAVYSAAIIVYYELCSLRLSNATLTSFEVMVSPNPYAENFNLNLNTSSEENVGVMVYDMTGRLIERRNVAPNEVSELQLGSNYTTGVYNIIVSQGTEVKTLKVIKR